MIDYCSMLQQGLLYLLTFISGLFFGSFLNLVADRVPRGKKILMGRSECDFCKKSLSIKNLVPVFSFLFQKGKCSFCKKKLSYYYPLSEIMTGVLFVGSAYLTGVFRLMSAQSIIPFLYVLIVMSFYIILVLTDIKYQLIPNKIVIPAIVFVALFQIISMVVYFSLSYFQMKNDAFGVYLLEAGYLKIQISNALRSFGVLFLSSFSIAGFFYFLVRVTKGKGMGGGDITLALLISLFNGWPYNLVGVFLGFIIGAVVSLVLVVLKKKSMKDTVPFGPFLILGSLIAIVFGSQIWQFYTNLF